MTTNGNGKYTAEQMITAIKEAHGNLSEAARNLHCGRATVYRYISRYSTVRAAHENEREQFVDLAENELYKQVEKGNLTAIIFTLKTIGKHRGYIERQEFTGKDGKDLILVSWDDDHDNSS